MNRRTLPIATALTTAAFLLLTACGSDDEPGANDKIAGVDSGGPKSASPSALPENDVKRPDIQLPGDIKDSFEDWKSSDPTKDAVLTDAAEAMTATNYAITQGDPDEPALAFYHRGNALVGAADWVKTFVDAGLTYTGTVRYYDPELQMFDSKSGGLVFCADESQAFSKNRKTGKINKTPVTKTSYVLYSTRLEKNADGIWQTTELKSKKGQEKCTP
ncbi:hypothetical protein OG338_17475 [Streptomyces sp. NBC_00726]|uniref:hypothetical protein n=1 Tax=Streptomyces sp. NBC_00726 TaxID=2903674 RepID=UPI00386A6C8A